MGRVRRAVEVVKLSENVGKSLEDTRDESRVTE